MSSLADIDGVRGTVLVVGSEMGLSSESLEQLELDGFTPRRALTTAHARLLAGREPPGLVILAGLDDGREVMGLLREIRSPRRAATPWDPDVPVLVVCARVDDVDLLRAFDGGADDVVRPRAHYLELRARLDALLRRSSAVQRHRVQVGGLKIDRATRTAIMDGRSLALSRLEFELLAHLASDPRRVFTKQELLRDVWGFQLPGRTRTLDSHASRLRRKLGADGRWLINVWGVGYRLTA